jgi:transposase-like protein
MIKRRRRLGAAVWRELLARFTASGLSAVAFCEREKISPQSLYRWRAKLGQSTERPIARDAAPVAGAAGSFLDLGSLNTHSRMDLRLDFGAGVILQISRP